MQTFLLFILFVGLGIIFFLCVLMSTLRNTRIWKAAAYILAMIPVAAHAWYYGFVLNTFLTAVFFLGLTWLVLYYAKRA